MDKENTPPPERRGPRAITPSGDSERRFPAPEDVIYFELSHFDCALSNYNLGGPSGSQTRLCR